MTATILDGKGLADKIRAELRPDVAALTASGRPPGLAAVIVGDDPASAMYVRNKARACGGGGVRSEVLFSAADLSKEGLLHEIARLNARPDVHGILVQQPLPPQIAVDAVVRAVSPAKDVDCFHPENVGLVLLGTPRFAPADMVRTGAIVVDVGINRVPDPTAKQGHRTVGDVDFAAVSEKAAAISPVPGGVGPMTIAMLLTNTVRAAQSAAPVG